MCNKRDIEPPNQILPLRHSHSRRTVYRMVAERQRPRPVPRCIPMPTVTNNYTKTENISDNHWRPDSAYQCINDR